MPIQYKVTLTEEERLFLTELTSHGKTSARKIKRANILLKSDEGGYDNQSLAEIIQISESTIHRTKRAFVEEGLTFALEEGRRPGQPRKLSPSQEATLISIACTKPPAGCCRWTLSLIGESLVALTDLDSISIEAIRQRLKENQLKPWQKKMWCLGKVNNHYIARMEHILDLYSQEPDDKRPIVNFDEAGKQLVNHVNEPKFAKPGSCAKEDYEYQRAGVSNIFMFFDRHKGWRKAKVTDKKTAVDFAYCMRELVDEDYPEAEVVRVVMDNLATHCEGSLYAAFEPKEAMRILKKLEFHFTPKHASWLNMAEIEIGNMNQQCLNRRIPSKEILISELAHWQNKRNREKATIKWMFNVDAARQKFGKAYSKLNRQN